MDPGKIYQKNTQLNLSLTSSLKQGENHYSVVTEKAGVEEVSVITSVYFKGKAIARKKIDYGRDIDPADLNELERVVRKHHLEALSEIESGLIMDEMKPRDYIEETRAYLKRNNSKRALEIINEGLSLYPDDPFILSYFGSLISELEGRHYEGTDICQLALNKLAEKFPVGLDSSVKPIFYLNLCRAQLASGDKKAALDTIYKGLDFDSPDGVLYNELVKLGVRRKLFFPFLKRSNPLNKYIGMMLHRRDNRPGR
jgi:tetratricopeptide (TPR) repeat protein